MSKIRDIKARQILDSRGNPTIEVDVVINDGVLGRASVPSGASTGKHEAIELRDNNPSIYGGKSVLSAVRNVNVKIKEALINKDFIQQKELDNLIIGIDGTENKSNLGANAMLGVSLAFAHANARLKKCYLYKSINTSANRLPMPMMNILNGGAHADNKIDFQEFMIMPIGATSFSEALQMGTEVFHCLKVLLKKQGYGTNVGDEGGFAPNLDSNEQAIELVIQAIEKSGFRPGIDIGVAIDAAMSEIYDNKNNTYLFQSSSKEFSSEEVVKLWEQWVHNYPIVSIEDALDEDDWVGWKMLTEKLANQVQLVGDDLFVTNPKRLKKGIDSDIANSILIKVNQIGTLTETIQTIEMAKNNKYTTIMSHRSGETEDVSISDLAVALNTGQIKTGSLCRSDRVAKYNQLLRIEEELGTSAVFGEPLLFL